MRNSKPKGVTYFKSEQQSDGNAVTKFHVTTINEAILGSLKLSTTYNTNMAVVLFEIGFKSLILKYIFDMSAACVPRK